MDFKKLKPIPMRPECEPDYDKQVWQPNWYCFCCHDTGFVIERLAAYVIEGYTTGQHKIARCRGSKCQAEIGETLEASGSLDNRLTRDITLDDFWRRAKRARNQNIKLKENNLSNSDGRELGTIESIDSENNFLKISLDDEIFDSLAEGHYSLPQEGLLSFEARGDLAQIDRKKKALRNLEKGRTQNPYLGQFLFDASQARESREDIQIQPQDLLLKTTNPSQKAAVETVLSAPDLALIQGPPEWVPLIPAFHWKRRSTQLSPSHSLVQNEGIFPVHRSC